MFLLVFGLHARARGGHAVLPYFFGGQFPSRHLQAAQLLAQTHEIAAGVEQRAESHVAADARKAIKICEFHGSTPPRGNVRPARNVSDGSISIVSAALRGVKSRMATPPPSPPFPGSAESKRLKRHSSWICTF